MESEEYNYGRDFIKESLASKDWKKSKYHGLQNKSRHHRWSPESVNKFIRGKYDLVRSIALEGPKEPLLIDRKGYLVDGLHRYFTLLELGHSAIVRKM